MVALHLAPPPSFFFAEPRQYACIDHKKRLGQISLMFSLFHFNSIQSHAEFRPQNESIVCAKFKMADELANTLRTYGKGWAFVFHIHVIIFPEIHSILPLVIRPNQCDSTTKNCTIFAAIQAKTKMMRTKQRKNERNVQENNRPRHLICSPQYRAAHLFWYSRSRSNRQQHMLSFVIRNVPETMTNSDEAVTTLLIVSSHRLSLRFSFI